MTASTAILTLPSVPFLKPIGQDNPDASSRWIWLSVVRAPIAEGRLVSVLDDLAVMTPGVFLYHPGKRQMLPKLRAFIDHIKSAA